MIGSLEPRCSLPRKRLMCTSMTLVVPSQSDSHRLSQSILRVTTWPAWRMSISRMLNSVGVRSMSRPAPVTRRVAGQKLRHIERLAEVIVSPLVEAGDAILHGAECGQDEHRRLDAFLAKF